jgi:hypothetical protein
MKYLKFIIVLCAALYIIERLFGTTYPIEGLLWNRGFQVTLVLIGIVILIYFILYLIFSFLHKHMPKLCVVFLAILLSVWVLFIICYNIWSFLREL